MDEKMKKYGVETYQPEKSAATTHGEGQEGGSGARVDSDGGNANKTVETARNGLKREMVISEEEAKRLLAEDKIRLEEGFKKHGEKHRRILTIVLIVAAVLVIAGVGFALVMGKNESDEGSSEKRDDVAVVTEEEESENELIELSVDDEVVQRVWKNVSVILHDVPFAMELPDGTVDFSLSEEQNFYGSEGVVKTGMTDRQKLALAIYALQVQAREGETGIFGVCGVRSDDEELIGKLGTSVLETWETTCLRGESVREKYQEIFGDEVELEDGEFSVGGDLLMYSARSDGYFSVGGRGGDVAYLKQLYAAQQDSERLYLYEVVVIPLNSSCAISLAVGNEEEGCYIMDVNGNSLEAILPKMSNSVTLKELMLENKDELDRFRWTFVKNEEEKYVFEKLEKVEV